MQHRHFSELLQQGVAFKLKNFEKVFHKKNYEKRLSYKKNYGIISTDIISVLNEESAHREEQSSDIPCAEHMI